MARRGAAECPICRNEVKLAKQKCFEIDRIQAPGTTAPDPKQLLAAVISACYIDYRSGRQYVHWACDTCLEKDRAILANPKNQKFWSCWPYYAYFSVKFTCPKCETSFLFDKADQLNRFETEKKWVQVWPKYCRVCSGLKLFRPTLKYEPIHVVTPPHQRDQKQ